MTNCDFNINFRVARHHDDGEHNLFSFIFISFKKYCPEHSATSNERPDIHCLLSQVRYCEDIGISSDLASKLYIYNGLSSIFGKIFFGRLCDFQCVNARYICQAAEFVAGTATILVTLSKSYAVLAAYVVVFGICEGAFISTVITIILTCVPEEQRASAIGWQWLLSSFTLASGPPLVGELTRFIDTPLFRKKQNLKQQGPGLQTTMLTM